MVDTAPALDAEYMRERIKAWLREDLGPGDVTSLSILPDGHRSRAVVHAKQAGVLAGLPVAEAVFAEVDPALEVRRVAAEGGALAVGDVLLELEGSTLSILSGERLALNLLQRLSGIATATRAYVDAVQGVTPPPRIVDTRKTTPGLRALEKYAVRVGGGHNHRFGLFDAVLLKDNHVKAAGGVLEAVARARAYAPHTMRVEIEVESLEQVEQAIESGADIIMLDNMAPATMRTAVERIRQGAPRAIVEASGGVTLATVRAIAETGVDVISVGGLTHSVKALDISLDLFEKKGVRA
ncbi:carboxylating nicotinate-nucleotide diphosphorylase [Paenibacillus sp.]|uniref:carboxylating nicotinate-nucleotide diphosphorylase n=1 Tax=Paenibacillus sp. TaxID=58172 RepID=UPI002D71E452|nr:carboxylating nicotinate-nucleotide diphosphorylase [Paenibacillus sp.]HZG55786.1 carboxylating nicotinate-nucleotide diphosphorylase [Paenibacillus sp.]